MMIRYVFQKPLFIVSMMAFCMLSPLNAFALPITYRFAGNITKVNQYALDSGVLRVGDSFNGSFTFEPDDLKYDYSPEYDYAGGNLQTGDLDGFHWEMTSAGFSWQSHIPSASTSLLSFHDAKIIQHAFDSDRLSFHESHDHSDPVQGPPPWEFFSFVMSDYEGDQLNSLLLPAVFDLNQWEQKKVLLRAPCYASQGLSFDGELTTLYRLDTSIIPGPVVPEPGTLFLFSAGLLGLAGFWGRNKNK